MLRASLFGLLLAMALSAPAQLCTTPGQTPITPVFVCGTEPLTFSTAQFCGNTPIPVSCPAGSYTNKNPSFFRFACFSSGTLGFIITPDELAADLNWQLFDITGTNPVDIFTNPSLFVAGNWSMEPGSTGASDDGTQLLVCAAPGNNPFSSMPSIVAGKSYLLMVSNESATTGPFSLQFIGGTATISDAVEPNLREASLNCDRTQLRVTANKNILCSSVAADGSDFSIAGATILSATPFDCSSVFGTVGFTLTLGQPLPLGNHQLVVRTGSDGNTLTDICNRSIAPGNTLSFSANSGIPTPMNEIRFEVCNEGFIELAFGKKILCSSLAADGSDFIITGPQALVPTIDNCAGSSFVIRLLLPPNFLPGDYQLRLATGSDGNSIIDECGLETPPGGILNFRLARPVKADFIQAGNPSCGKTDIQFSHDGANQVTSWDWSFGAGLGSTLQNPTVTFPSGNYSVRLIVSNGECSDTAVQQIRITGDLAAAFHIPEAVCEGDTMHIENTTKGFADTWDWDLGNGVTSSDFNPPAPSYTTNGRERFVTVRLIANNITSACMDTVKKVVRILPNCSLSVPSAFTPNGDGRNDFFGPVAALRAREMNFRVFNRFGQMMFSSRSWNHRWDGRVNGVLQETGVYAWVFEYTDASGIRKLEKGTVVLIR